MGARGRSKAETKRGQGTGGGREGKTAGKQPRKGPAAKQFPVIGIGASAGGLEAFGAVFNRMPEDTGMAFILIQHIEPSHVANMVSLIQKQTRMPVVEVKDGGVKVEPNHLYMIPQNREISITDGTIKLCEEVDSAVRHSVDLFFRSLAEDLKDRAICIILSGTGTDGTIGARAVKAQTGLVIVQDPEQAGYAGMPQSAIDAGVADMVLPAEHMAEKLLEYVKGAYGRPAERRRQALEKSSDSLQTIFRIIKQNTRRDFSGYKVSTVNRRIERRMGINRIDAIDDYIRLLRESQDEVEELVKDFLIQVTSFFRDPEAFQTMKKHLKALIKEKGPRDEVRAWTVGCSTGEEAYSVAIVIDECLRELDRDNAFHVFGTDLDANGIDTARAGLYPESIEADVSKERLRRYFTKEDGHYRVNRDLRERLVFAVHDIITDPPFSHMDLVLARNLLIYLHADTQSKVVPMLHYGLRQGGILFMGTAETIGESHEEMFETLDRKWRIYRARADRHGALPVPSFEEYAHHAAGAAQRTEKEERPAPATEVERTLLKAMPPAVLVDRNLNILYVHGETRKYLQLREGTPSNKLLELALEDLRMPLATATHLALRDDRETVREGIRVKANGATIRVKITVRPVRDRDVRLAILFEDMPGPKRKRKQSYRSEEDERYKALEQELQFTKENLKSTVEELETSNEELRSTLEEHQSTNEELNSTNEELESSREELQSMNEELNTINAEYSRKLEELSNVGDDMRNLLNSTDIATIFLDGDLTIKRFTPATARVLNLRDSDVGRPITDITSRMKSDDLAGGAKKVLDDLVPVETEAHANDGLWYSVRMLPYRTSENAIQGVVISFIDITGQKQLQEELKEASDELQRALTYSNSILDTMCEPMVVLDGKLRVESVNQAFCRTFKVDREETEGGLIYDLGSGQWDIPELRRLLENILPENSTFEGYVVEHDFPAVGRRKLALNGRRLQMDEQAESKILLAMQDITGRSGPARN